MFFELKVSELNMYTDTNLSEICADISNLADEALREANKKILQGIPPWVLTATMQKMEKTKREFLELSKHYTPSFEMHV